MAAVYSTERSFLNDYANDISRQPLSFLFFTLTAVDTTLIAPVGTQQRKEARDSHGYNTGYNTEMYKEAGEALGRYIITLCPYAHTLSLH